MDRWEEDERRTRDALNESTFKERSQSPARSALVLAAQRQCKHRHQLVRALAQYRYPRELKAEIVTDMYFAAKGKFQAAFVTWHEHLMGLRRGCEAAWKDVLQLHRAGYRISEAQDKAVIHETLYRFLEALSSVMLANQRQPRFKFGPGVAEILGFVDDWSSVRSDAVPRVSSISVPGGVLGSPTTDVPARAGRPSFGADPEAPPRAPSGGALARGGGGGGAPPPGPGDAAGAGRGGAPAPSAAQQRAERRRSRSPPAVPPPRSVSATPGPHAIGGMRLPPMRGPPPPLGEPASPALPPRSPSWAHPRDRGFSGAPGPALSVDAPPGSPLGSPTKSLPTMLRGSPGLKPLSRSQSLLPLGPGTSAGAEVEDRLRSPGGLCLDPTARPAPFSDRSRSPGPLGPGRPGAQKPDLDGPASRGPSARAALQAGPLRRGIHTPDGPPAVATPLPA